MARRGARQLRFIGSLAVVVIGLVLIAAGQAWTQSQNRVKTTGASAAVKLWLDTSLADRKAALAPGARLTFGEISWTDDKATADLLIGPTSEAGAVMIHAHNSGSPVPALSDGTLVSEKGDGDVFVWPKAGASVPEKLITRWSQDLAKDKGQRWTLGALGDVIFGRGVASNEVKRGPEYFFAKMADQTKAYDLTLADLECTLADGVPYPSDPTTMSFISPTAGINGLKSAGIDAVSIANNHSYNGGATGYGKMIEALDGKGMPYFGGGKNVAAARQPLVQTVKGVKVALLGYSSITGSVQARDNSSGMNVIGMQPWGQINEAELAGMEADIKAAKQAADVVIVYYHWGVEYTHVANDDQRTVAHRAVDAGADVIVGTHPHWVQGVEWYKNKLITYSLGNFVFDQNWAVPTQQGTVLSLDFVGKEVVGAKLVPYRINSTFQPEAASTSEGATILGDVIKNSWWSIAP